MPFDYLTARATLDRHFAVAERRLLDNAEASVLPAEIEASFQTIFESTTQAYREVLLGCAVARMQDGEINIRLLDSDDVPASLKVAWNDCTTAVIVNR